MSTNWSFAQNDLVQHLLTKYEKFWTLDNFANQHAIPFANTVSRPPCLIDIVYLDKINTSITCWFSRKSLFLSYKHSKKDFESKQVSWHSFFAYCFWFFCRIFLISGAVCIFKWKEGDHLPKNLNWFFLLFHQPVIKRN